MESWLTIPLETPGAWCAYDATDLIRFLAYSSCRIHEAANVKRDDVDLDAETIRICGDPVHRTKNSEPRTIPINPAMQDATNALPFIA
jgi:integrase